MPWWAWVLVALAITAVIVVIIVWVPAYLVVQSKASADGYLTAITNPRTTLVQAVGGLAVFLGVVVGFLTLRHNREALDRTLALTERGQFTDRFSRAIEQLGRSKKRETDLRLGGIYALEQLSKDSPIWHQPIVDVLAAFVRQHCIGLPLPEGETVAQQQAALPALDSPTRFKRLPVDLIAAL